MLNASTQLNATVMCSHRTELDPTSCASALKQCARSKDLPGGQSLHNQLLNSSQRYSVFLRNHLVEMYGECGSLSEAKAVFDGIQHPNAHSWAMMLKAFARNGSMQQTRRFFDTLPHKDVVSCATMITAYVHNGETDEARQIFDAMPEKNVVVWNAMISAYAHLGDVQQAQLLLQKMTKKNVITWTAMLAAYIANGGLQQARSFFDRMPRKNLVSWNVMLAAYAEMGEISRARDLFDKMAQRDSISWNTLLMAYVSTGKVSEARALFDLMPNRRDPIACTIMMKIGSLQDARALFEAIPTPDLTSVNCMINLYVVNDDVEGARIVFDGMKRRDTVSWKTMIAGYVGNGRLDEAMKLLREMPSGGDVVSWTSLMTAYVRRDHPREALNLFAAMDLEGVDANVVTFLVAAEACGNSSDLFRGRIVHEGVTGRRIVVDCALGNALLTMYCKCGSLSEARTVFDAMRARDEISWNSLIAGFAQGGRPQQALELFFGMSLEGVEVSEFTLSGILVMCSHTGLMLSARDCFVLLFQDFGVSHKLDHYNSMVDHLSRAGKVAEAEELLKNMPFEADFVAWKTLLSACRNQNRMAKAVEIASRACEMDPTNSAAYILLSNLFMPSSPSSYEEVPQATALKI